MLSACRQLCFGLFDHKVLIFYTAGQIQFDKVITSFPQSKLPEHGKAQKQAAPPLINKLNRKVFPSALIFLFVFFDDTAKWGSLQSA